MITNKEYEEALQNQDNINIMNSVCSRFSQSLDYDDLYRCKLMGLWRALRFWKHDGGRKFTNFLYRSTYWSCLKALKQKSKHGNFSISTCNITTYDQTPFFEILDGLPHDLKDIMHKKYVDNMTLEEIGEVYGCSYETIRKKIGKAVEKLKKGV